MKDISPLFDSIHDRLASRLSSLRHVRDEELYDMIDAEIQNAGQREFLSVREKYQLRSSLVKPHTNKFACFHCRFRRRTE